MSHLSELAWNRQDGWFPVLELLGGLSEHTERRFGTRVSSGEQGALDPAEEGGHTVWWQCLAVAGLWVVPSVPWSNVKISVRDSCRDSQ